MWSMAWVTITAFNKEGVWMLADIQDIDTMPSSYALDLGMLTKKKAGALATSAVYRLMDIARV